MNNLQIFKNDEFGEIRTVMVDGEPWFVGKDLTDILGYQNASKALADHVDEEDKLNNESLSSLGQRGGWLINESGLYSLILSSKLPTAKKFKHWVTTDILPSVRKHGAYMTPAKIEDILLNPDTIIQLAQNLKAEQEKNKELHSQVESMKPAQIFADAVSASESSILMRDLAKLLKQNGVSIGEKRLYSWMRDNGYICKNGTSPTQKAMELKLFEIVIRTVERGDGLPIETTTTRVTGKGQNYFVNKFLGNVASSV